MDLPHGFRFAGRATGIKKNQAKKDLVLIISDVDAVACGVFTTNKVCAAPVQVCRDRLPTKRARGIIINSGNANACTGEQGLADAKEMTASVARLLSLDSAQILVCSTGVIGRPLPMAKLRDGIPPLVNDLQDDETSFESATLGIMTTDTRPKTAFRSIRTPEGEIRIVGFAKGAAMIGPNMATMLAFILTDAVASADDLQVHLRRAVDRSFHSISVEGHTSTNDSVILMANGAGGASAHAAGDAFAQALDEVAMDLAMAIVDDAEEATHRLTIDVKGTRTEQEARQIAKAVADSPLVKTAVFGNDPNWGRICSAAGYSGVDFAETDLSLRVNGTLLYDHGMPTAFDPVAEHERMKARREVDIELIFELGTAGCRFWSCDLSTGYVRFNAEYTT
ncbi:bifunctional glutamate N-acetyltransferase/amino-acid acetyltransferase ArgJ [bacterium]|nr:bifunctional glutamate N-acetyltransferase/amino-acid acetyltransferase ArgJ [bacterium]